MNDQEIPRPSQSNGPSGSNSLWVVGSCALVLGAGLTSLLVWLVPDHAQLLSGEYLVCSPNTFRDFEVVRWVREGWLPLEGPSTSIGGHHGYLSYWIIGAIHTMWPSFQGMQGFGLAVLVLSLAGSGALAYRVSGGAMGLLGLGVYLASPILFLIHYPNHIVLIPVATCLTLYGLLRAREGWFWVMMTSVGLVLAIGAHRTGWLLLAVVLVLHFRFHLQWLRKGIALIPIGIYLIPEVLSRWVVEESAGNPGMSFLGDMDPLLVLLTMPFHQFKEDASSPLRWVELLFALGVLFAAFKSTKGQKEGRAIWWFYGIHFAVYPWYRFDLQYYMGMFAVLPALTGVALQGLSRGGRPWQALVLSAALGGLVLANGWAMHQQVKHVQQPESKHFRSVQPELETIRALDKTGATRKEVLECSDFPIFNPREFAVFYGTFSEHDSDPTQLPARRFVLKLGERSKGDEVGTMVSSDSGRILFAIPAPTTCGKAPKSYSEQLLYWHPASGELKQQ